jgi:hypothetical protein
VHNPVYYHPRIHQVLHRQNQPEHLISLRFFLHGLPVNFPRGTGRPLPCRHLECL